MDTSKISMTRAFFSRRDLCCQISIRLEADFPLKLIPWIPMAAFMGLDYLKQETTG